jgi:serine/threonine protein kinase
MPERIGKYRILERIGRGSMGIMFKAHDPVFDRAVALKLFAPEIAVTDEFRGPFFREAHACIRLSHPNIITVYDVGEDDGRLFIAMELVEGQDLRHAIAERRPLALEDKLSVMMQVCEGLHYAHEQGIVHGCLDPRDIFLSEDGRVKLAFGIGQIVGTDADPTRTGRFFHTTCRYPSPEQLRGRADRRSDIFLAGALFYELLSFRPPFIAEDPPHVLDQLRTEDPPSLVELDPTISPELSAIVERALRKDPSDRFPDLEQVRSEIERFQQGLREETERLQTTLRGQLDQIFRLQPMLAQHIGTLPAEESLPRIDAPGGFAAMQAIERDLAARIAALQDKIGRAETLAPAYLRGTGLLRALRFADAAIEFEAIIADMPEHARAQEGLRQARAQAEEQRRRQLTADLLREARVALDGGAHALCLEILGKAKAVPAPAAMVQELAALAQTAAAALQAEEAARRERGLAERARDEMAQARREAQDQDASHYATDLWTEAEASAAEAQAYLAQKNYAEAGRAFQSATAALRRAVEAAGAARAREQEAAERARVEMARCRDAALAANAAQYAPTLWNEAESKSEEARVASSRNLRRDVRRTAEAACLLYREAGDAAREARQRERQHAEEAREQATQSRQSLSAAGAEGNAIALCNQADGEVAEGEADLRRELYAEAIRRFDRAEALYAQARRQVDEIRRQRDAEQKREYMVEARDGALAVEAAWRAHVTWNEAEARSAAAGEAFASGAYAEAAQGFEQAAALYRRAAETARESARRREMERAAGRAREAASAARQAGVEARAPEQTPGPWSEAEAAMERATVAFSRSDHAAARSLFGEAQRLYESAARAADAAADEAQRVEAMISDAKRFLESGEPASCLRRLDDVLAIRPRDAAVEALRIEAERILRQGETIEVRLDSPEPARAAVRPTEPREATPAGTGATAREEPSGIVQAAGADDTSALDLDATLVAVPRPPAETTPRQPAPASPGAGPATPDLRQTPASTKRPAVADSPEATAASSSRDDPSTALGTPGADETLDLDATLVAVPRPRAETTPRQPAPASPGAGPATPDLRQPPASTKRPAVADSPEAAAASSSRDDPSTALGTPGADETLDLDATLVAVPRPRAETTPRQPAPADSRARTSAGRASATERVEAPLSPAVPDDTSTSAFDVTLLSVPRAPASGHEAPGKVGGLVQTATSRARLRGAMIGLGLLAAIIVLAIIYCWLWW